MQNNVGQSGDTLQTAPVVEIGQHGRGTGRAPFGGSCRVTQQCIYARAPGKAGEDAAGNVPAADDQDFLHGCIVADQ